jgi:hypothetical protein
MSSALDRLKNLTAKISSYELERKNNLLILEELYQKLSIIDKIGSFEELFDLKAINLSGISLGDDDLGVIKEGKYVQIIGIRYEPTAKVKNKNISLAYYGRAEKVNSSLKTDIITFILAWRFEKSFRTLEHYHVLMGEIKNISSGELC